MSGSSEQFVGEFIKDHRQSVVLSTKYSNALPGNDANAAGQNASFVNGTIVRKAWTGGECGEGRRHGPTEAAKRTSMRPTRSSILEF